MRHKFNLVRVSIFFSKYKDFLPGDLLSFQRYLVIDILHKNVKTAFRKSYGRHADIVHKFWHFCVPYVAEFVHQLWHTTGFQLFCVNSDGCHMWDKKCSLFPGHLISLPLQKLSVLGLYLWINDWSVCLDWPDCICLWINDWSVCLDWPDCICLWINDWSVCLDWPDCICLWINDWSVCLDWPDCICLWINDWSVCLDWPDCICLWINDWFVCLDWPDLPRFTSFLCYRTTEKSISYGFH